MTIKVLDNSSLGGRPQLTGMTFLRGKEYSAGPLFRHFRRTYSLTQRRLALILGVTVRYVKKIEAGERFPSSELMQRFKDAAVCYEREQQRETVGSWKV